MQIDLQNLPSDRAVLHHLVRDMATVMARRDEEIERLCQVIKQLQRSHFGRRSERLDPDQLALALEDLDSDIASTDAPHQTPDIEADLPEDTETPGQTALPGHLPRESVVLDAEHDACPDCGGALHAIGESVSEMLDWVPARLRVIRIRRPKYGCRGCGTIHQSGAPDRLITRGLATPGLISQVLISKYCDHTPLYRQSQIFARQGVELSRSTLARWVGGASWWLEPLHERLRQNILASDHLFADDTPLPVLDPGRGRTKTGRLWAYARDQRGWGGADPPAALYCYEPDRRAVRPAAHLADYKGVLHVDGYAGFETLAARGDIVLAACWAHTRRKFYEVYQATGSPIAAEALSRIGDLYTIERHLRGQAAAVRLSERNKHSGPLIEAMKPWLEGQLRRIPPKGPLAEAIRYALNRWMALTRFLDDGHIELDTNPVERAIRPIALGRKNHMFAGSDKGGQRWAIICSLIETAKLNGVEPYAWLSDTLQRMVDGHPNNRLDELLPWNQVNNPSSLKSVQ